MIEKYGLFDSLEGDVREYAEADLALLVSALGRDGVRGGADALKVQAAAAGLAVTVEPGLAIVQGRYYALRDDGSGVKTLSLTAATGHPRIDRIVLTLDDVDRAITLGVLQGTEAVTPAAPALTRAGSRYMISLAQVLVPVGAAQLTASAVTDERADEALCGLFVASADAALASANTAQDMALQGIGDAKSAQGTAQQALAEAKRRALKVAGVSPDAAGNVALGASDVGAASAGHTHAQYVTKAMLVLNGTTLTITTT